nr:hypothetical protein [Thermoactinospora rubra]
MKEHLGELAMPASSLTGLDSRAGDTNRDALAAQPSAQVIAVVSLVCVELARIDVPAVARAASHVELGHEGLEALAVVGVAR